jgi:hypothetical protein
MVLNLKIVMPNEHNMNSWYVAHRVMCMLAGLLMVSIDAAHAQGCSDAGFCTLPALQQKGEPSEVRKNHIEAGFFFGIGESETRVMTSQVDYGRQWSDRFSSEVRLTHQARQLNSTKNSGLGDLFLSGQYRFAEKGRAILGLKIPLADGNDSHRRWGPLPMDLQTSLGTWDLIAGVSYTLWRLDLFLAWQQPLTHNKNTYISPCEYDPSKQAFVDYAFPSTNQFHRAGDLMMRLTLPLQTGQRWVLTPGILPIYHLANDSYVNLEGIRRDIEGSRGWTVNLTFFAEYRLSERGQLLFQLGAPVAVREARPDGLTRFFASGLSYRQAF